MSGRFHQSNETWSPLPFEIGKREVLLVFCVHKTHFVDLNTSLTFSERFGVTRESSKATHRKCTYSVMITLLRQWPAQHLIWITLCLLFHAGELASLAYFAKKI